MHEHKKAFFEDVLWDRDKLLGVSKETVVEILKHQSDYHRIDWWEVIPLVTKAITQPLAPRVVFLDREGHRLLTFTPPTTIHKTVDEEGILTYSPIDPFITVGLGRFVDDELTFRRFDRVERMLHQLEDLSEEHGLEHTEALRLTFPRIRYALDVRVFQPPLL